MFLIGIAIFVLGYFMTIFFKGLSVQVLLNPSAITLHLFAIAGVLTATQSFKVFWYGLQAAVFPKKVIGDEVRGRAASLFRLLSKTAILTSVIGLFTGAISALSNFSDPEALGHALAAALTAPFWGMALIAAVFEPIVFILKKRQDAERKSKPKE